MYKLIIYLPDGKRVLEGKSGQLISEICEKAELTEENTMGFYEDYNYRKFVDIYNTKLTKNTKLYTRIATLSKIGLAVGIVGQKYQTSYGEIVVPRRYRGEIIKGFFPGYEGKYEDYEPPAFEGRDSIISVYLPYGIEVVSRRAFMYCRKLKYVNIPSSVKSIESGAFGYCKSLESLFIPSSVKSIENAFEECVGLKTIK